MQKYGIHENDFEEFSKIRSVDGNAISDLSMYNYLEVSYIVLIGLYDTFICIHLLYAYNMEKW